MFADLLTNAADWARYVITSDVFRWLKYLALAVEWSFVIYVPASWLTGCRRRGELVARCRPLRGRWLWVALAVALLIILSTARIGDGQLPGMFVCGPAIVMMLIYAQGERGVYENGIWCHWFLIGWNQFVDYSWHDLTLVLRINPSRGPIRCSIRHEQQAAVQAVLDRNVPSQSNAGV